MVITPHALLGVAMAKKFKKNLASAYSLAFLSHFLLDAIPHTEYPLRSLFTLNFPSGLFAFFWLSLDLFITAFLVRKISGQNKKDLIFIFFGAVIAISPDILAVLSNYMNIGILSYVQAFHIFIHSKIKLSLIIGIIPQIIVVGLAWVLTGGWKKGEIVDNL